ncbi:MAG: FAD-binding oxidoreductase, partial [Chloroflexota bacterium]
MEVTASLTDFTSDLCAVAGRGFVLSATEEMLGYEHDASIEEGHPEQVVLAENAAQVAEILKLAARTGVPVTPRGAGTGLSGGAVAAQGGMQLTLSRLDHILEMNAEDRYARVQPGVVNIELSHATAAHGLAYAPDPSSQKACTIGGNVAENAGGPHCLAYGTTVTHVLELELAFPGGKRSRVGSLVPDRPG